MPREAGSSIDVVFDCASSKKVRLANDKVKRESELVDQRFIERKYQARRFQRNEALRESLPDQEEYADRAEI